VPRGAPPGSEPLESDVPWDPAYLELVSPTPLEEVQEGLLASVADVERALAEFDSEDEGRLISFEQPAARSGA
jgi:hypothetical protein